MSTIKDVAQLAGVSVATVSRVLNGEKNVRPKTKEIVREAIKELNYSPNLLGRHLRRSNTKNVLVLLPTISNQFYSTIIKGIHQKAEQEGYNIMISITDLEIEKEERYMKLLETKVVDGAILFAPQISKERLEQIAKYYPVVQCSEYIEGADVAVVSIDNFQAAYDATEYLIKMGHERIAMITSEKTYTSSRQREQGFRKALQVHGINLREEQVIRTNYSYRAGMQAARELMTGEYPPTAIFTIADSIAVGAIKAATEMEKQVGKDIDIIGFDDTIVAKVYNPSITTVTQPRFHMGEVVMGLMLDKIRNMNLDNPFIKLEHQLVIRDSTRKSTSL